MFLVQAREFGAALVGDAQADSVLRGGGPFLSEEEDGDDIAGEHQGPDQFQQARN